MSKSFALHLVLLLFVTKFYVESSKVIAHFTKYECKFSDAFLRDFIYPNFTCFVKNYGKRLSTFNTYLQVKKPIVKMIVSWNQDLKSVYAWDEISFNWSRILHKLPLTRWMQHFYSNLALILSRAFLRDRRIFVSSLK